MLPYTSLLHRSTRESLGISLKGSVVVLDEAHNIIETVNSVHSAALAQPQIALALSHLSQYLARYRSRLKGKNILYIKQLLHVLRAMHRFFQRLADDASSDGSPPPTAATTATASSSSSSVSAGGGGDGGGNALGGITNIKAHFLNK